MPKIIYTETDEAPMLATYSFKPIVEAFASTAGVEVETRDISLAARILAQFPDRLTDEQRVPDTLAELGELVETPEANIVKLPNISASIPQLKATIKELQADGYDLPDYPEVATSDEAMDIRARYDRVKGSAVNPVLREGNSDRRAPKAVKNYARQHPHSMGAWSKDSKTNVATLGHDDFRSNEKSVIIPEDDTLTIQLVTDRGTTMLKESLPVLAGEVVDGTFMSATALDAFLAEQVARAKSEDVLFSTHLKATMMKVSDPIIFGHVVTAFFRDVFDRYGEDLAKAGLSPNDGLGGILSGLDGLDNGQEIKAAFDKAIDEGPELAYVNSDKGITNLHVLSDVIVDASMPAMIRTSGKMWGREGEQKDTLAVLPDSSYAGVYQVVIDDCRENGAFDPTTMGTVPNVGLMAQKAEEYGSHDKTFEIQDAGTVQVVNGAGEVLLSHEVQPGDIWRACQAKDAPIKDWVQLAVRRSRDSGMPAVFWLDESRAHDRNLITKVEQYLAEEDTDGLDLRILSPAEATKFTVERLRRGEDTISVTGNVLRDYLTDLFPILELGTSAKMLSIVPLMNGGGLFETGAEMLRSLVGSEMCIRDRPLRQRQGAGPRGYPGPRDRDLPQREQVPVPEGQRARQPRFALLPGHVLGRGARAADRGLRARAGVPEGRFRAARERGHHQRRTAGRAGFPRGSRRVLLARPGESLRGDAPLRHAQRDRGRAQRLTFRSVSRV